MAKPLSALTRHNANEQNVVASDFPKSGFNLSYKSHMDLFLGRNQVQTYQPIMPNDKFNGGNSAVFTLNDLQVPVLSDISVSQHNFYVPFRIIDTDFEEFCAPSKDNNLGANNSIPMFSLKTVCETLAGLNAAFMNPHSMFGDGTAQWSSIASSTAAAFSSFYSNLGAWLQASYCSDIVDDLKESTQQAYTALANGWDAADASGKKELVTQFYCAALDPIIGENSLMDTLGMPILSHEEIFKIVGISMGSSGSKQIYDQVSVYNVSEYPLRAYYAIWYSYYRDVNLEHIALNDTKYNYKKWSSTAIVGNGTYDKGLFLLFVRMRAWDKDSFTTCEVDDLSRHVYAPVFAKTAAGDIKKDTYMYDFNNAESVTPQRGVESIKLRYLDKNGTTQALDCPVPTLVNDSIKQALHQIGAEDTAYTLDLMQLRQSKMLENYLKRNFYFGDEYRDRILAQYGCRVSDMRVNRPELLSTSVSNMQMKQQISSTDLTSVGGAVAGQRTAIGSAQTGGDNFTYFAEEFGVYIGLISAVPIAQYDITQQTWLLQKYTDFPIPALASGRDECLRILEMARYGIKSADSTRQKLFGHVTPYHAWRTRNDEVHGSFLSYRAPYTFWRRWSTGVNPVLNSNFIHCRPKLDCFVDTILLDGQAYGTCSHDFFVERVLPSNTEFL